ncbi:MAG: DNA polymerase IV [Planctomycetes bacterium]|nr:DNA polymerase IV [Planctomycetota bacterium]
MKLENLILHVDIDAFFASVEQLLIPALRGRPVIVGSGVIASCSYEARRFGLKAGMPLREARRLCPRVEVLKGDAQIYRCFAEHVWEVCRRYMPALETYLDEAYGDATGVSVNSPPELGEDLRRSVAREVGLPVSVGLGANRMMAKIASSAAKPGGVKWIPASKAREYLAPLPVRKLPGVGGRTEQVLRDMNITTIGRLCELPRATLEGMFGMRGSELYDRCRGIDDRGRKVAAVNVADQKSSTPPARKPKTISRETTFHHPTCDAVHIEGMLFYLLERAMRCARSLDLYVGAIETRIRYDDWKQVDASHTLAAPTQRDDVAFAAARDLLGRLYRRRVSLRHVGVTLSKFSPAAMHGRLFETAPAARQRELCEAVDGIRDRFGHAAVVTGASIDLLGKLGRNEYGFILRTPSLTK